MLTWHMNYTPQGVIHCGCPKTNMEAEALALLEGVQLCLKHGLHYVQVDLDSKTLQLMSHDVRWW